MIYDAYENDTTFPLDVYRTRYPADLGAELREDQVVTDVRTRLHKYRGFTHTWKIWKGRRPRVNVFCSGNVYSETMPTNVITY
jgi:hypothetical protein